MEKRRKAEEKRSRRTERKSSDSPESIGLTPEIPADDVTELTDTASTDED